MVSGKAQTPLYKACLTLPQGYSLKATGTSKKIAKNMAAKLMVEKLEGVKGLELNKCVQNSMNVENNSVAHESGEILVQSPNPLQTTSQPTLSPVANFFLGLLNQERSKFWLDNVLKWNPTLGDQCEDKDWCSILELVAREQGLDVVYCSMLETEQSVLSVVQVSGTDTHCLCLGEAAGTRQARQTVAHTALVYIRTMIKSIPM